MIGGEGDLDLHARDNISVDLWGNDAPLLGRYTTGRARIIDNQEQAGGYPAHEPITRAFDPSLWDMATMKPVSPAALDSGAKARGT